MAAQQLSSSVVSGICFLREDMDIPDFQGSEATTVFIRCIDELFDLLNSRNPFGKGNKAPITKVNLLQFMEKCEHLSRYIFNLKDECGRFFKMIEGKQDYGDLHSLYSLSWPFATDFSL